MADLGYNDATPGTNWGGGDASMCYATHDTSDGNGGTTDRIYVYAKNGGGGARSVSVGVYSDDAGNNRPQALLAAAATITIPEGATGAWYSAAYVVTLAANTKYWLGFHVSSADVTISHDTDVANRGAIVSGTSLPDPWPDAGNTASSNRRAIYATYAPAGDTTAPTITAASIDSAGTSLTLTADEAISVGAGGNGGMALTASGGAASLTYSSGSGSTSVVYTIGRAIQSGETVTLAYTQPGNGWEDGAGNDLASFSGKAVTNNSTQVPAATAAVTRGCGMTLGYW